MRVIGNYNKMRCVGLLVMGFKKYQPVRIGSIEEETYIECAPSDAYNLMEWC